MVDVGKQVAEVARALNKVRTNGAALVASTTAAAHGSRLAREAESLPGAFLRGGASGKGLARALRNDVRAVEDGAKKTRAATQLDMPVNRTWWEQHRRAIERIYVDGSAVYAAQDARPFGVMVGELGDGIVKYGEKLAAAGAGAPGVLLGDALRVVGANAGNLAKGAGAGVTDILGGVFSGLKWPLLIIGGVLVAVVVFTPPDVKRAAVSAASKGAL